MVKYANPKTKKEIIQAYDYLKERYKKIGKEAFREKYGKVFPKIKSLYDKIKGSKKVNDSEDKSNIRIDANYKASIARNSPEYNKKIEKRRKAQESIIISDIGKGNWFTGRNIYPNQDAAGMDYDRFTHYYTVPISQITKEKQKGNVIFEFSSGYEPLRFSFENVSSKLKSEYKDYLNKLLTKMYAKNNVMD